MITANDKNRLEDGPKVVGGILNNSPNLKIVKKLKRSYFLILSLKRTYKVTLMIEFFRFFCGYDEIFYNA